jgi:hypothetical protein
MKMINVLQRLAELDAGNPNVVSAKPTVNPDAAVAAIQKNLSEELSSESLKYLAGVKNAIAECGMMPQMPMTPTTPASFSINATAANGDEVAGMLTQIMNLAGVKPVGPTDMPVDKPTTSFSTVPPMASSGDDMKRMLDTMNKADSADTDLVSGDNKPEDEGTIGGTLGAIGGGMMAGPLGAMAGYAAGSKAGDDIGETDADAEGEIDISGVGGALAGAAIHGDADGAAQGMQDGEDDAMTGTNDEMRKLIDAVSMDNTPADPTDVPTFDGDKHAHDPNTGDHRERQAGLARANPMETVTSKLFADYEEFIAEAKEEKFNPLKHVKNPTKGEKDAAKDVKRGSYADRAAMLKSAEADGRLKEGYYDLNDNGMQPIDLSSKPSFKEILARYTQLVYQGHASETSPEEDQEYDAIEKYVAQRFGEKGSAHLQKAGQVSYWGRDDKPYGRDSRSSNLGRPNQPSGDFRTTKAGKMHGQDAKIMKAKVADRLGRHPEPNLPEQTVAERTMSRAAKGHEKYGKAGMAALAKAGRDGAGEKKLDAIRDKHDKYN